MLLSHQDYEQLRNFLGKDNTNKPIYFKGTDVSFPNLICSRQVFNQKARYKKRTKELTLTQYFDVKISEIHLETQYLFRNNMEEFEAVTKLNLVAAINLQNQVTQNCPIPREKRYRHQNKETRIERFIGGELSLLSLLTKRVSYLFQNKIFVEKLPKHIILNLGFIGDGTTLNGITSGVFMANCYILYDRKLFKEYKRVEVSRILTWLIGYGNESCSLTEAVEKRRALQVAQVLTTTLNTKMGEISFRHAVIGGDNSHSQKVTSNMGSNGSHRCSKCSACFATKEEVKKHFNQFYRNKFKKKTYKMLMEYNQTKEVELTPSLAKEIYEEVKNIRSDAFKGFKVYFRGKIQILQSNLKELILQNGGEVTTKDPTHVVCTLNTFKEKKLRESYKNAQFIEVFYFLKKLRDQNTVPHTFIITEKKLKESEKAKNYCLCKTKGFNGNKGTPVFLTALQKELKQLVEERKANQIFAQVLDTTLIACDPLHTNKGHVEAIINKLIACGRVHKENLFKAIRNKFYTSLHALSGAKFRRLIVNPEIITEHLKKKYLHFKPIIERIFCELAEINFISNSNASKHANRKFRLRLHLLCYRHSKTYVELFPNTYNKDFHIYTHTLLCHLADDNERYPLISLTTESSERSISTLNKTNKNNKRIDTISTLLTNGQEMTSRRKKKYMVHPEIRRWLNSHAFEQIEMPYNNDIGAFLFKLSKYGYSEQEGDWKIMTKDGKKIVSFFSFKSPHFTRK